jgi:hypothetical protein
LPGVSNTVSVLAFFFLFNFPPNVFRFWLMTSPHAAPAALDDSGIAMDADVVPSRLVGSLTVLFVL